MSLVLSHLQIHYPGQSLPAVADVSFDLQTGQIGALIGPSGCGKTTVLRAVAGLEPVSAGRISLAGKEVSNPTHREPPENRRVGMVFQDYALFPHMTVKANIGFGLNRLAPADQSLRIQEVLDWVGLGREAHKFPHELSGGQQQRVALARALAPKPDLLLLDEPFSNLDVDLRERLAQEMRQLLISAQTTALFVTHDQNEAFAVGDRVGVLDQGRLHQWGDPYTLYHAPASRFVATFIGDGVFLPGRRLAGPTLQVQTELGVLEAPQAVDETAVTATMESTGSDDLCDVLIRTDDVVVGDAPMAHSAVLVHKAFRGAHFLYTLRLASGTVLSAMVPSHQHHQVGDTVGFTLQLDHLITFPTP
jgi:iron(III) transport system ATP-binding protein